MKPNMATKKTSKKTFQERMEELLVKERAMYEKENVVRQFIITFPKRHKPPLFGKLGAWLIAKSGGEIQIQYNQIKK